jgi:hypothetical protein
MQDRLCDGLFKIVAIARQKNANKTKNLATNNENIGSKEIH